MGFTNSVTGGERDDRMSYVSWETGCLEGASVSWQRCEDGKAKESAGAVMKGE